jgi:hypothetical protein
MAKGVLNPEGKDIEWLKVQCHEMDIFLRSEHFQYFLCFQGLSKADHNHNSFYNYKHCGASLK